MAREAGVGILQWRKQSMYIMINQVFNLVTKGLHDVKITNMFIVWCISTEWHTIVLFGAPCKLDLYDLVA